MSETVTLELPDDLAQKVRRFSAAHQRRLEDVVVDWIGRAVEEPSVESLSDDELLTLCDSQLDDDQQNELSQLLALQSEGVLSVSDLQRLDELMGIYRKGLVTKARAWRTAVARGLRPPLNEHAA